jgi:hypothetical protein
MPIHIASGDGRDILESSVLEIEADASNFLGLECPAFNGTGTINRHTIILTEKANLSEANPSAKICPI